MPLVGKEFSITTEEMKLTITGKEWGNPNGNKVLALHGWLDNANSFDPLAPYLKDQHLVCIDWPGHGQSQHFHPLQPYNLLEYLSFLLDLLATLRWENFSLLAHSMGAVVATLSPAVLKDQITSMILIEGLGPFSKPPEQLPTLFSNYFKIRKKKQGESLTLYESIEAAAQQRFKFSNVDFPSALLLSERGTKKSGKKYIWSTDPRLMVPTPHPFTEEQVLAFIDEIKCPTLLILADQTMKSIEKTIASRLHTNKSIQHETLKGSHHIHMEDPESIFKLIKQKSFL